MTEHWRSVVPALSTDAACDQTSVENDRHHVETVRQRYAFELKHLTQTAGPLISTGALGRPSAPTSPSMARQRGRAVARRARNPDLPRLARNRSQSVPSLALSLTRE